MNKYDVKAHTSISLFTYLAHLLNQCSVLYLKLWVEFVDNVIDYFSIQIYLHWVERVR